MITKYYLYDKDDNSLHRFDKLEDRDRFSKKRRYESTLLFRLEMGDDFALTEKPYTIDMYMDDDEGYSLGYMTTMAVSKCNSEILAEWGEYENAPYTSLTKQYPSLAECLKEYVYHVMQPKKKT